MKKTLKYCKIVSLCMIVAGLVLIGVGLLNGGSISYTVDLIEHKVRTQSFRPEDYVEKTLNMDAFSKLQLNVNTADVEIKKGEAYEIYYYMRKEEIPSIEMEGQELVVSQKEGNSSDFTIGFWQTDVLKKERIIVTVPEDAQPLETTINVESGDILLQDMVFDKVDICGAYGSIEVSGVISDYANISGESGDITLKDINLKDSHIVNEYGDLVVENGSGDKANIILESGDCQLKNLELKDLHMTNEYGEVVIEQSTVNSCEIENESGEIEIANCRGTMLEANIEFGDIIIEKSILDHVQAICESGDVEIHLIGELSEYDLDLITESGEISINGEENGEKYKYVANKTKNISVENEFGDVDIVIKEN